MCLGIPGKVVHIAEPGQLLGVVDVAGIQRPVDLSCVLEPDMDPHQLIGRWVLVHVGFAMSVISEQEAGATLALLADLAELGELGS